MVLLVSTPWPTLPDCTMSFTGSEQYRCDVLAFQWHNFVWNIIMLWKQNIDFDVFGNKSDSKSMGVSYLLVWCEVANGVHNGSLIWGAWSQNWDLAQHDLWTILNEHIVFPWKIVLSMQTMFFPPFQMEWAAGEGGMSWLGVMISVGHGSNCTLHQTFWSIATRHPWKIPKKRECDPGEKWHHNWCDLTVMFELAGRSSGGKIHKRDHENYWCNCPIEPWTEMAN